MIKLFNSLTKNIELFKPINDNDVTIYCCGVTVYDLCHLGHARSYIVWDVLRRFLIFKGYEVKFVQNFTDIDDKILKRAREENTSMKEISERNIQEFFKDMDSLGIMRADKMPKATNNIFNIVELIKILEHKGCAYSIDGDVYFSVNKSKNYGKLSNQKINQQNINQQGRITSNEEEKKIHPQDFALWKKAKNNEPFFDSPWGNGRPGWHIECSAMVKAELGETIDIHLGGSDLIFPHHENEIAQSECAYEKDLANYWLHNGMVNVNGQKMSKSLKNFTTIRDLLNSGVSPMALRYFVLTVNYRKPLDFTDEAIKSSSEAWKNINMALSFFDLIKESNILFEEEVDDDPHLIKNHKNIFKLKKQKFIESLSNDINTASAISVLYELSKPLKNFINQYKRNANNELTKDRKIFLLESWKLLVELSNVLGFKKEKLIERKTIEESDILKLVNERLLAKKVKDYKKADNIRSMLKKKGIELIDKSPDVTTWINI